MYRINNVMQLDAVIYSIQLRLLGAGGKGHSRQLKAKLRFPRKPKHSVKEFYLVRARV